MEELGFGRQRSVCTVHGTNDRLSGRARTQCLLSVPLGMCCRKVKLFWPNARLERFHNEVEGCASGGDLPGVAGLSDMTGNGPRELREGLQQRKDKT